MTSKEKLHKSYITNIQEIMFRVSLCFLSAEISEIYHNKNKEDTLYGEVKGLI